MRATTADLASFVATTAGRTGALAAAAAEILGPLSPGWAGIAGGATFVRWVAGGVEQVLRPNAANYIGSGVVDLVNYFVSARVPLLGPALNEAAESIKGGAWMQDLQNSKKGRK
ncbi:hypothetical protein LGM90_03315 [Burkholderia sp. AU28942]|uniref:hypothetical protein n=1 Tax=Burkholderia TaxID=32008 RepID=UPI0012EA0198|nr:MULTISPECIES: hypothetical protein [Burkholderia]MCA8307544.1 hypothetical protein [Burkholderia sp. AU28942]QTO50569.1 hypothetical protein J8I86_23860 [Burkholderia latens]